MKGASGRLSNVLARIGEAFRSRWSRLRGWVREVTEMGEAIREANPSSAEEVLDVAVEAKRHRTDASGVKGSNNRAGGEKSG